MTEPVPSEHVPSEPVQSEAVLRRSRLTRRHALALGAMGGLSLPVLTACGGSSTSQTGGSTNPGTNGSGNKSQGSDPSKGGSTPSSADVLTKTADVPVGGGVILGSQNVTVTQPVKGTFKGFSATCTHQGCTLATVASGTINCGCHGSQFSITDGSNVAGPSGTPAGSVAALPEVAIKIQGGDVLKG